eukprot:TRINITY_DN4368_c0_g1_i1.p1 TRINITY_DN4368_c0_g1~~TRINITY_DN4368_c0_g1_i1.p1  ORF type:complete len:159 (+),score=22.06 TRINITY_DN4368_c0_g1_i1:96-572(+)
MNRSMSHFDETSGVVECPTHWGSWYQTMEEVVIQINLEQGTRGKEIQIDCKSKFLAITVKGSSILNGQLPHTVVADELVWSVEDNSLLRVVMTKSARGAGDTWQSLLVDQYEADPVRVDEMQKKMTLERFQRENPGFDFSGADISGQYQNGGPQFPST